MALPGINIDDRNYAQLVSVLRARIPGEQWTDHNPSDPGMMLLELLCWLGEMALYRMNRLPDAHRSRFLNLVIDPPEPVTVEVTFELAPARATGDDVVIPAGVRLATDFAANRRFVFETIDALTLPVPAPGDPQTGTVTVREFLEVRDEELGTSDGTANQGFPLRPPRRQLGLPTDRPAPVLLDLLRSPRSTDPATAAYDPNPRVTVGGVEWQFRPFLLTDDSGSGDEHFTVDPFTGEVRFGDGRFGRIPPAGEAIRCSSYRVLQGTAALVPGGALQHILNPEHYAARIAPAEALSVREHPDAEGGLYVFPEESRLADGLRTLGRTYRVVTPGDFEEVLLRDFNEFEAFARSAPAIPDADQVRQMVEASPTLRRVIVRPNRRPPLSDDRIQPGHVTLLVLPDFDPAVMEAGRPFADKVAAIAIAQELGRKITRFLETRRLITTRLHLEPPELTGVGITLRVVVRGERRSGEMEEVIGAALHACLSPLEGGPAGSGWPPGRDVHPSELYRLIESVDGVDHVRELTLTPVDADRKVPVQPHQLPVLDSLAIFIERAAELGGST